MHHLRSCGSGFDLFLAIHQAKDNSAIAVKILKRRGRWESEEFTIAFNDQLLRPMPDFSEMVVDQNISTTQEKQPFDSPPKPAIQTLREYQ